MRRSLIALLLALAVLMAGCTTATIRPEGNYPSSANESWSERQHFFLFGLIGESHIDVQAVCGNQKPAQMQSRLTFLDWFLGLITVGIYSPQTARVWCE